MSVSRKPSGVVVVLVTCPTSTRAVGLAETLVKQRLAACVNILPSIRSVFRWQGKIDRAKELLLLIKTTQARFPALERAIRKLHPYDVPEVLALRVAKGFAPYLEWVAESVRQ